MTVAFTFTPENLAERAARAADTTWRVRIAVYGSTVWLPVPLLVLSLALVVLGAFPAQEPALYLTAVAVGLYIGAITLFVAVFWRPSRSVPTAERAAS
jgi:hypothetical protein